MISEINLHFVIFVVTLFLLYKIINYKSTESLSDSSTESLSEGGLTALTNTSKLLVTDDNGNLSTYTPASEGFSTNELKITDPSGTNYMTSNSTGSTFSKLITANGGIEGTTAKYSVGITASSATITGKIEGSTASFSSMINANGGLTSTGDIKGNRLCIGNTCITESELKQLVRPDMGAEMKPSQYYNLLTGSSLFYKNTQNVSDLGYAVVETYINGNISVRIQQTATKILWGNLTSDQYNNASQIIYSRYSMGNKDDIIKNSTLDTWSPWVQITDNIYNNINNYIKNNDSIKFFNSYSSGDVFIKDGWLAISGTGAQNPAGFNIKKN